MTLKSSPAQRQFRLQFSLRMLLLLTALVAVALAVFRWPWEVRVFRHGNPGTTQTTTYHRGWTGASLKHGPQSVIDAQTGERKSESLYEEDVLRRQRSFNSQGQLVHETLEFPERGETLHRDYHVNRERSLVAVTRVTDNGQHLRREWWTNNGKLLESDDYFRQGNIGFQPVRWNDRPVAEVSQELLNLLPQEHRDFWAQLALLTNQKVTSYLGEATFYVGAPLLVDSPSADPLDGLPPFRKHNEYFLSPSSTPPNGPLIHELLSWAHAQNQTLQCRFGVLCMAPINAETAAPGDPTGALAVQFAAGTTAAAAWLETVACMDQDVASPAQRLQQFFADTGIEIDASGICFRAEMQPDLPKLPNSSEIPGLPHFVFRRTRRDTLGIFLWHHRLRVEQRGNKLIVLPRKQ